MREEDFKAWLETRFDAPVVNTQLSRAKRLARAYGDLDVLHEEGGLDRLQQQLAYSKEDQRQGKPSPATFTIDGDLYAGLASLRKTIDYYRQFLSGDTSTANRRADAVLVARLTVAEIEATMDDCDAMGADAFLRKHGYVRPSNWAIRAVNGERYPAKGIVGIAIGKLPGEAPRRAQSYFDGFGESQSYARLRELGYEIVGRQETRDDAQEPALAKTVGMTNATNLILYGPPGTGKTYRTAAEAVRLCDGLDERDSLLSDPARRGELRSRYDHLVDAGQVRLVTFHQNYSYEEFVEGLRPVTDAGGEEDEASSGAGFRLEPKRGIFREICAVAENARKNVGRRGGFDLAGRKLFKMSLGRSGQEDHIFDGAIEGGYAVLGWGGDVDWSDPRYVDFKAILGRWREDHPDATGNDPNVVQLWSFRSAMKEGDLVVVSAGNSHFRAIGEVAGPYRYDPGDTRSYNHRRAIRWLHVPDEPLPVEMIYGKKFMMQSCYQMKDAFIKRDALSRLLPGDVGGTTGQPDQFVLIIDEINRANVSKVFGELITLIEPDKRLGSGAEQLVLQLPYSGESFGVPANLHIVGTMNTADRSIALLDTALRRRFVFRELAPDPALLPEATDGVPLRRVLETINDRIEYLVDREHRIGHAFFLGQGGRDRDAINATMRDKVIPLLQEYFFEDWARVAAVLGERPGRGGGFLDCRKLRDPTGGEGDERESWSVRPFFADDAYDRLIGKAALDAPHEEAAE